MAQQTRDSALLKPSKMKSVICLATEATNKGQDTHPPFLDNASSSVCNTIQSGSAVHKNKRRSYTFNESSGQMERIIRKRKRKTTN